MDDVSSFNELSACKGTGVMRAIEEFNEGKKSHKKIYKKESTNLINWHTNQLNFKIDEKSSVFIWDPDENYLKAVNQVNYLDLELLKGIDHQKEVLYQNLSLIHI